MGEMLTPDICVIGAGSGGLSVAAAAAQFGVDVVLIEKDKMGGDCLNTGCVPSKALLAAGKRAQAMRKSEVFGIAPVDPAIDWHKVLEHVHGVIATIEPNDSVERFTALGVKVIQAAAKFTDRNTVKAGDTTIRARRFVIATGSSPAAPPVPGLANVPYFTNETIFHNKQKPNHLMIIGGGPIGMEMAQAHHRLGCRVTVLEAFTPLAKDDPELTSIVLKQLKDEGITIVDGIRIEKLEQSDGGITAHIAKDGKAETIEASHLLVAAGRKPNVDDLGLEAAGIKVEKPGITVSKGMKTSNKKVYAIGDVAGGPQFTHIANYHAGIVIRNALFRMPVSVNYDALPWVTYTDPELAHVGLNEAMAKKRGYDIRILRFPYNENDRAISEHATTGFVKVITSKKGRILGATIVGAQAGEIIQMWTLAISAKMKIKAMTGFISPYPTLSEINKRASYGFYAASLTSSKIRSVIGWLRKLG